MPVVLEFNPGKIWLSGSGWPAGLGAEVGQQQFHSIAVSAFFFFVNHEALVN